MAAATKKRTAPAKPKATPIRANLRDQFAMAALPGLIALKREWTNSTKHYIVSDAYAFADAMLLHRANKEEQAA